MCDCGIVTSLLRSIGRILFPVVANEFSHVWQVEDNFNELKESFQELEKQLEPDNILDRDTENSSRRLCHDVEDLVNDTNYVISEQMQHTNGAYNALQHTNGAYNALHPLANPMGFIRHMKLPREIGGKLDAVQKSLKNFKQKGRIPKSSNNEGLRNTSVRFDFKQVESESTEAERIINKLTTNQDSNGVSIIGLRGMGKRALARHIFDQSNVKTHFPLIVEASFPDKTFQPEHLILEILWFDADFVSQERDRITPQFLRETNHKWLLWMDDLPKMPRLDWQVFVDTMRGTFLFTTVNPDVATTTKTSSHFMGALSDICCTHLVSNCGGILSKCYGLISIAQFLTDVTYIESIFIPLWQIKSFKDELLPYLASNFQSLKGATLKCFYYLSLFPEEHEFDKEELILLWIGAGLVEATGEDVSSFLQKGQAIFDDLLQNSVLPPLRTDEGKYQLYKFSHCFAQYVAPKIYLQSSESLPKNDSDLCHLSVAQNSLPNHHEGIKVCTGLRTFLLIWDGNKYGRLKEIRADLFSQMIDLRVLVLKNTDIVDVPYLRHLKRLRLLDISDTLVHRLPEDLSSLSTLQILKFKKCRTDKVVHLPDDFSKMTSLVFVDWDVSGMKKLLPNQPHNIGRLVYLETLPLFVVTNKKGHHITELEKMNRLQNSLRITNLEAVPNQEDAKKACISEKKYLHSLELQWTTFHEKENAEKVLSGLQPHNSLKELHVVNYHSNSYPTWFGEPSFLLQKIYLVNCSICCLLQSFGRLEALEFLHLERMHTWESMDKLFERKSKASKNHYFKALKSLVLISMEDLRDWKKLDANYIMPELEKLEIKDCQNLKTLPPLKNLNKLKHIEIEGCQELSYLPELPSSLQSLIIKDSNSLARRCQDRSPDWLESGHILQLEIDSRPTEIPKTASSKPESSPSQQTSGNPLAEAMMRVKAWVNGKSPTDQQHNTTVPKDNVNRRNTPRITYHEKGKAKMESG